MIPFSSIDRYAQRHGIEGDSFHVLLRVVRALDTAYVEHANKKG